MYRSMFFFLKKYLWQVSGTRFSLAPYSVSVMLLDVSCILTVFRGAGHNADIMSPQTSLWPQAVICLFAGRVETIAIFRIRVISGLLCYKKPIRQVDILRFVQQARHSRPIFPLFVQKHVGKMSGEVLTGVAGYRSAF